MAKFRVRLKLQGFELEIDGERGDIPAIASAVEQQFAALVKPAEMIAEDREQGGNEKNVSGDSTKATLRPSRRRSTKASSDNTSAEALQYRHDSSKYGNPVQSWNALQKLIWLLIVVRGSADQKEVSSNQLVATYNQHYKASGKLPPNIVSRELAKAKVQNPAWVGEDKTLWYLTDEGERQAQQLVQSVLNPNDSQPI
jgi:hypothetical protein